MKMCYSRMTKKVGGSNGKEISNESEIGRAMQVSVERFEKKVDCLDQPGF